MKMHLWIGSAACGVLLMMLQGCCHPKPQPIPTPPLNRSITYLTTNGDPVAATETGQTLEWRMAPTTVSVTFDVTFVGLDPCGKGHKPLHGDNLTPASCVVTVEPVGTHYVPYRYRVEITLPDSSRHKIGPSDIPWQVVPCPLCGTIAGPVHGTTSTGVIFTENLGITTKPAASDVISGLIKVSCVKGSVTVDQNAAPVPAGHTFQWEVENGADWTVTFPSTKTPCGNYSTFTSVSGTGNQDTCVVPVHQTPDDYPYKLHVDHCSVDASVKVVVTQ